MLLLVAAVVILLLLQCSQCAVPCARQYDQGSNSFSEVCIDLPEDAPSRNPNFMIANGTEKYRSRTLKELAVLSVLYDFHNGYYVDVGASHWEVDSNTFVMDYHNMWQGICIETNPVFHVGLLSNRRCTLFISSVGKSKKDTSAVRFAMNGEVTLAASDHVVKKNKMVVVERNVTRTTLTSVLNYAKAPKVMHYLSLPGDGSDLLVLQGLDSSKYTFQLLTVDRPKYRTHFHLAKSGYRFLRQVSPAGACLYVHETMHDLGYVVQRHGHAADYIPYWQDARRTYVLHPQWNETLSGEDARRK